MIGVDTPPSGGNGPSAQRYEQSTERLLLRLVRRLFRAPLMVLALLEAVALLSAPLLATYILGQPFEIVAAVPAVVFAALQSIALLSMGLYSRQQRARMPGIVVRVLAALAIGSAAFALLSVLFSSVALPRPIAVDTILLSVPLIAVIRYGFEAIVDEDIFKRRVLVYGAGRRALGVAQLRRRTDTRGFRLVGYIVSQGDRVLVPAERVLPLDGSLLDGCRRWQVDEIVIGMDDRRRAFPVHELLECRLAGIAVTEIVDFLEAETGKVRLDVLNPSWIIFAPGFGGSPLSSLMERLLDVAVSVAMLAIAWPVMLLAAFAIKLEDGWSAPVFYSQTRVGLEGRHFNVYKFRSMRIDAERPGTAVWAVKNDVRVTRIGGLMRKIRIDELPQLLNILRGDMRFVGPRPERPEFVSELEDRIPYYRERHTVKPGLTGWAQLCYSYGASEQDATEKLQYDLYYLKNRSLIFDLMILVQTAEVVLLGKGAR